MANVYLLDTNVVISLAKYHKGKTVQALMANDGLDYYKAKSIEVLYKLIKEDKITAVIPPVVYDEILQGVKRFGPDVKNFVEESNIRLLTNLPEKQMEIASKLANFYFKFESGSKEKAFEEHNEKYNGKNDAHIMALCSVLGLSIITFDKHFTNRYFTIKEANEAFKKRYLKPNNLLKQVSSSYDFIKIHKPTFVMKKYYANNSRQR